MKCILYVHIFPFPLASHPSSLYTLQSSLMGADILSGKSLLICPWLCLTLRYQTEFLSSPSFNFVSLYLRNRLFQKPWFLVYKNAEEEVLGKQDPNIFQAAIWGIPDLTKLSSGFWHLTSSFSQTLSISPHSAMYFGASIRASEEFKK